MGGSDGSAAGGVTTVAPGVSLLRPVPVAPGGQYVELGEIATVEIKDGPPMISSEQAMLRSIVYLNVRGRDAGGFVAEASRRLSERLHLPAGYTMDWSGTYEQQQHASQALRIIVPLVLLLIFLLLRLTLRDWREAGIVMLSVPFALVGGVFLVSALGMNWSVAVWVGFIALYGVATETGVVMVVYLHEALDRRIAELGGAALTERDIYDATVAGAVLRLRPKLMTVATAMIGLIPILFSDGAGADVMRPIAAPMIGGMLTSAVHVLVVTPVIFYALKVRTLRASGRLERSRISDWMGEPTDR